MATQMNVLDFFEFEPADPKLGLTIVEREEEWEMTHVDPGKGQQYTISKVKIPLKRQRTPEQYTVPDTDDEAEESDEEKTEEDPYDEKNDKKREDTLSTVSEVPVETQQVPSMSSGQRVEKRRTRWMSIQGVAKYRRISL